MSRRNPRLVTALGALALVVVLLAGVFAYWRYANQLPAYPRRQVVLPVPNAYDDFAAAGRMSRAASAATIRVFGKEATIERLRGVVLQNRAALARLRQGFAKRYSYGRPVSVTQEFPDLADFRTLARGLALEGELAEREGRMQDAVRSYLDCLRLGVEVPRGGLVIHGLVGIAIHSIGLRRLEESVDHLDGPTAARAARELARLESRLPPAADTLTTEKEEITAGLLTAWRDAGSWRHVTHLVGGGPSGGPDSLSRWDEVRFAFTPKASVLAGIRSYMDALIANARRPYHAAAPLPPLPGDPLSPILLPMYGPARLRWAVRDAHWRVIELRLAARAYERLHGAPPVSATALAPAYLPAIPSDPFAPQPLVYRRQGARALIYSRGPDGDDDGGRDLGPKLEAGSDGDLVSMRQLHRPRNPRP